MATIRPQTLRQAKAEYKKHGPQFSRRDQKVLDRELELQRRADKIREQEKRRRVAMKKRVEKEAREREARRQNGIGFATQLAGFNHTQVRLKNGMEAFLGLGRAKQSEPTVQSTLEPKETANNGNMQEADQDQCDSSGDESLGAISQVSSDDNKSSPRNNQYKEEVYLDPDLWGIEESPGDLLGAVKKEVSANPPANILPLSPEKQISKSPLIKTPKATPSKLRETKSRNAETTMPPPLSRVSSSKKINDMQDFEDFFTSNSQAVHDISPEPMLPTKPDLGPDNLLSSDIFDFFEDLSQFSQNSVQRNHVSISDPSQKVATGGVQIEQVSSVKRESPTLHVSTTMDRASLGPALCHDSIAAELGISIDELAEFVSSQVEQYFDTVTLSPTSTRNGELPLEPRHDEEAKSYVQESVQQYGITDSDLRALEDENWSDDLLDI